MYSMTNTPPASSVCGRGFGEWIAESGAASPDLVGRTRVHEGDAKIDYSDRSYRYLGAPGEYESFRANASAS